MYVTNFLGHLLKHGMTFILPFIILLLLLFI